MFLAPGSTLGPYEIRSQLGQGGMGVVYLAQDPRLDRLVAIKVLPPDLTRDVTAKRRFLQEAKAASALDHPNICTIHEINETADGQLYLVMAHYEGETLKEQIARGPLAVVDTIDIATQVGQGLSEAHGAGIVHRDIKPANLLVTKSGTVKILDLGLAKLAGSEGVTRTGTTVGTVEYMSPEQARGQAVDHRTDIWALGVVIYETLTGQQPFRGDNLLAIAKAIQGSATPTLTGAGAALNGIVGRALSKSQLQRYRAVTDMLDELRRITRPTSEAGQLDVPSVAVLPFRNMSADPEQEYFCEGMAEEIIDALARLEGLRVVARTSAFQFKGQSPDLREVGEKLRVKTVLEGSVRKARNRLRINAELINAEDGYHLWSERYDREMDDVFAVQDEIARSVVEKLKVQLLGAVDTTLVTRRTRNLESYHLYLRGRHHFLMFTADAFMKSQECFAQAVSKEPTYAQAHAGIAMVHAASAVLSFVAPPRVMHKAKEAALHALDLDETVADAHAALGLVLHNHDWDWPGAEREYRRALALNPGDTLARAYHAHLLACQGRADAAIAEARQAVTLNPLDLFSNYALALVLVCARRFEAATQQSHLTIDLSPGFYLPYCSLAWAAGATGQYREAVAALRHAVVCAPGDPFSQGYLGWALGLAGEKEEAQAILSRLKQRRTEAYYSAYLVAVVLVGLGEQDQAVEWLLKAFGDRDGMLPWVHEFPHFDPLRADPRFQALLRQMNFPSVGETGAAQ